VDLLEQPSFFINGTRSRNGRQVDPLFLSLASFLFLVDVLEQNPFRLPPASLPFLPHQNITDDPEGCDPGLPGKESYKSPKSFFFPDFVRVLVPQLDFGIGKMPFPPLSCPELF